MWMTTGGMTRLSRRRSANGRTNDILQTSFIDPTAMGLIVVGILTITTTTATTTPIQ